MVQFLSIIFFSWISSIFVGVFKSSRFFVSLCIFWKFSYTAYSTSLLAEVGLFSVGFFFDSIRYSLFLGVFVCIVGV